MRIAAFAALLLASCRPALDVPPLQPNAATPFVFILGIAQDGGYPQAGCNAPHCEPAWQDPGLRRYATALAIVDPVSRQRWLIDATPDFPDQLRVLDEVSPRTPLAGIFLTHAHIGHYTGLMHLGREVMGARGIPVYAMPRMRQFLSGNGPWDQLVKLENIRLISLVDGQRVELTDSISVTPFLVPHRDEYSETVGYRIDGPRRSVVFIPDIDKWERWGTAIESVVGEADVALLDGTFFRDGEIAGRSMADIPHPFIVESMERFSTLHPAERSRIRFIHLNHTNPALQPASDARREIESSGFRIAAQFERIGI